MALGGIPNKTQVGDMGIDGGIYPAWAAPDKKGKATGHGINVILYALSH